MRNAALRSPQAIFMCVRSSATSANDCASLPVPDVEGTPMDGSIGRAALQAHHREWSAGFELRAERWVVAEILPGGPERGFARADELLRRGRDL